MSENSDLPYRPCVGVALFNGAGEVFAGWRRGHTGPHVWQMPQGGIDPGEAPEAAAFRELEEETGVRSAQMLDQIGGWLHYDLPPGQIGKALKGRYRGQKQRWFAMRFTGAESEIRLDAHGKPEFIDWRWIPLARAPELVAPFKRDVYQSVAAAFAPLVESITRGAAPGGAS